MDLEVRNDDRGKLDEVVGTGYFHLERMDINWFCLIVDDGKRCLRIRVGAQGLKHADAAIYADETNDMCLRCLYSLNACKCGSSDCASGSDPKPAADTK